MEAVLMASQVVGLWSYSLPRPWLVKMISGQYRRWPLAERHLVQSVENMRVGEVVLQRKAINQAEHTSRLGAVTCPTLGIVGDLAPVAVGYMRRAIQAIPQARLEVVADSFDPSNLCQPETFNRLLADFLAANFPLS
jgi:3-oxoadipate enol-lactonase